MKKLFAVILFVAGFLFVFPTPAHAQETDAGTLRHAYKPTVVVATGAMRARIDNFAAMPVQRLVCVEAFQAPSNLKTHLGCLPVSLDRFNSMGMWAVEFDTPTTMLMPGSYRLVYTYRGSDNNWYQVKSVGLQPQEGWLTK